MADAASGCMMPGTALKEGANVAAHVYQQVHPRGRQRNLPGGMRGPSLPSIFQINDVDCWISRSGYTLTNIL